MNTTLKRDKSTAFSKECNPDRDPTKPRKGAIGLAPVKFIKMLQSH